MTLGEFLKSASDRLARAGLQCADPPLHAKQLAALGLGIEMTQIYLRLDDSLSASDLERLERLLARRLAGEPFQYIAGHEGFWDASFRVGPGVLIPRRETELLVEKLLLEPRSLKVAELGPGTGNIGVSVLRERPDWEWHAFELNPQTLPYLEANRKALLPASARYHIHVGDFFELAPVRAPFDALVTNPPYVSRHEMKGLPVEVTWEPPLALDGGEEGLECLGRLAREGKALLGRGGKILTEIGSGQGAAVRALFERSGWRDVEILKDYAGLDRVAVAEQLA